MQPCYSCASGSPHVEVGLIAQRGRHWLPALGVSQDREWELGFSTYQKGRLGGREDKKGRSIFTLPSKIVF